MTQRSVLATQSKLTIQAPGFGERGSSAPPCALPRIWGRSLERKFADLLT
ncbi:hypothetical protein DSBG_0619 [Desulfosporosinus sp. BG]|nr:hypothetical protein DSBG_0619 [Desulfosporosinus sp. BG]